MTTFANQHSQNDIRDGLTDRFILYPPLSKASNWTINLLVEPFKEKEKGNSPIHYPKSAKFPLTLVVNKYLFNKTYTCIYLARVGKAKAVAIQEEREPLIGTIMF